MSLTLSSPAGLDLPPLFSRLEPPAGRGAFAHACRIASEADAGTLVVAAACDLLDFAVILAPEEPLARASRILPVALVALAESVGACAPPEKAVTIDWPDELRFDGARIGGGRLGWPPDCGEDEVPDWLVFGAMIIASKRWAGDPGHTPDSTSLEEEGFEPGDDRALVAGFARRLMRALDRWAAEGFETIVAGHPGLAQGGRPGRALLEVLRAPTWLDPATGAPRL